jgi:hypothetical protein
MSLIRRTNTRITAKQVGEILGCSHKTVLNGGAGTKPLTRIRNGTKQVRFLLDEVLALAQRQENLQDNRELAIKTQGEKTYGQPYTVSL